MTVSFRVFGVAQPQGSARAFMAGGRPVITSSNKNLGDWRRLVADCAQKYARMHEGPLWVQLEFVMPAPKSLPKKRRGRYVEKRPDIDKLQRACLDALTGVMWHDDAQVADIWARKVYESDDDAPGVLVRLGEMPL